MHEGVTLWDAGAPPDSVSPDSVVAIRRTLRTADATTLAAHNAAAARSARDAWQPTDITREEIARWRTQVRRGNRPPALRYLLRWLSHPDEQVLLALLDAPTLWGQHGQVVRGGLYHRATAEAGSTDAWWTPLLDALDRRNIPQDPFALVAYWSSCRDRPAGRRSRRRGSASAPTAAGLEARTVHPIRHYADRAIAMIAGEGGTAAVLSLLDTAGPQFRARIATTTPSPDDALLSRCLADPTLWPPLASNVALTEVQRTRVGLTWLECLDGAAAQWRATLAAAEGATDAAFADTAGSTTEAKTANANIETAMAALAALGEPRRPADSRTRSTEPPPTSTAVDPIRVPRPVVRRFVELLATVVVWWPITTGDAATTGSAAAGPTGDTATDATTKADSTPASHAHYRLQWLADACWDLVARWQDALADDDLVALAIAGRPSRAHSASGEAENPRWMRILGRHAGGGTQVWRHLASMRWDATTARSVAHHDLARQDPVLRAALVACGDPVTALMLAEDAVAPEFAEVIRLAAPVLPNEVAAILQRRAGDPVLATIAPADLASLFGSLEEDTRLMALDALSGLRPPSGPTPAVA